MLCKSRDRWACNAYRTDKSPLGLALLGANLSPLICHRSSNYYCFLISPKMAFYPLTRSQRVLLYIDVVSATLWFCCLGRLLILLPLVGRRFLPAGIADFFHMVAVLPTLQWVAVLAIYKQKWQSTDLWALLHSVRLLWLSYGVIYSHPLVAKHTSYSFLIFSWCVLHLIDSCYHAFKLKTRSSPRFLFAAHYLHFYVTFPVSFVSELILVFLSLSLVEGVYLELAIKATFLLYVPVGYLYFRHLQLRKNVRYTQCLKKRAAARQSAESTSGAAARATATELQTVASRPEPLQT